jgi:hypothetical protein
MIRPRLPEPIRFTRGRRTYLIAPAYAGGEGYVGIRDGQVVVRGIERGEVARRLINLVG